MVFDFWNANTVEDYIRYKFLCVGWAILWKNAKQSLMAASIMAEFIVYYETSLWSMTTNFCHETADYGRY